MKRALWVAGFLLWGLWIVGYLMEKAEEKNKDEGDEGEDGEGKEETHSPDVVKVKIGETISAVVTSTNGNKIVRKA
jgi:hypothetical protein